MRLIRQTLRVGQDLALRPRRIHGLPPHSLVRHYASDEVEFIVTGTLSVDNCIKAGLEDGDRVLDVGCGAGRLAIVLMRTLPRLIYDGFDINHKAITWCRASIQREHPNFRFKWIGDVRNKDYNPHGTIDPAAFRFPYPDASFDFAILNSVFTHMVENDVRHYLEELHRVCAPRAMVYATFFMDDRAPGHPLSFAAVHPPERVRALYAESGFWIGDLRIAPRDGWDYQDSVVAMRTWDQH